MEPGHRAEVGAVVGEDAPVSSDQVIPGAGGVTGHSDNGCVQGQGRPRTVERSSEGVDPAVGPCLPVAAGRGVDGDPDDRGVEMGKCAGISLALGITEGVHHTIGPYQVVAAPSGVDAIPTMLPTDLP